MTDLCACHGEPKTSDGRCRPTRLASRRAYGASAKGREARRRYEEKRIYIGGERFAIGFTKQEREAMLA